MCQIPDVLVGFDFSKAGHPTQTNSIFYNPEQLAIGVLLHRRRYEIRGARIHPPPGVSGCMAVGAMTHCAFGAVELVPFLDARLQIRWCCGNTLAAAPTNQEVFCLCRDNGFEMAGLLKRVELYLSESHDHYHRSKREGNKYKENPALHPISPAREAIRKAREGKLSARPSPTGLRCRFNSRDVDRLGGLVQGSRNLYLLPGEWLGLFLVVQLVERLVCLK
jgi:hypothetical protein